MSAKTFHMLTDTNTHSAHGVTFLRRHTLGRAARGYVKWVEKAVGWATLLYLIFWVVVFIASGIQLLERTQEPFPLAVPLLSAVLLVTAFLTVLAGVRAPPVMLNRRDIYHLALAPASPWLSLRWPFTISWSSRLFIGMALGAIWSLVSPYWFWQHTPWSGPALALLLMTHLNLVWLTYAERHFPLAKRTSIKIAAGAILLSLAGLAVPPVGLGAAFYTASPLGLVLPLLLTLLSLWAVRQSLAQTYPPRFLAQSFILNELQTIRALQLFGQLSSSGLTLEPGERERLLKQLREESQVIKPVRSLRLPHIRQRAWQALAWRTWQALYRRPLKAHVIPLLLLISVSAASSFVLHSYLVMFLVALAAGKLSSLLLGPDLRSNTLPLAPEERTLGRSLPGMYVSVIGVLLISLMLVVSGQLTFLPGVVITLLSLPLALLLLEKYATWAKVSHLRLEAYIVSGLLAFSPVLILSGFELSTLAMPFQLMLIFILLRIPA